MSGGRVTLPCDLFHDACDVPNPLPRKQKDACENITFPQLRLRALIRLYLFVEYRNRVLGFQNHGLVVTNVIS